MAVSKPSPNNTPTGYMCHGLRTALVAPDRIRFRKPRLLSCSSRACSSYIPARIRRNTLMIPISTTRLRMPMIIKKVPDTATPTTPVIRCRIELSSATWPARARTPTASSPTSTNTIVEWPRENQKPTDIGRWPSAISLRVVLSIAAMWSASKACRMPRVYATRPRPIPSTPASPTWYCAGATIPTSVPQPRRCSRAMKIAMPRMERFSPGVSGRRVLPLPPVVPGASVTGMTSPLLIAAGDPGTGQMRHHRIWPTAPHPSPTRSEATQ